MAQRLEAGTLAALAEKDAVLVGQAELLRSMLEGVVGNAMLAGRREIEEGVAAITEALRAADVFTVRLGSEIQVRLRRLDDGCQARDLKLNSRLNLLWQQKHRPCT